MTRRTVLVNELVTHFVIAFVNDHKTTFMIFAFLVNDHQTDFMICTVFCEGSQD